MNKMNFSDIDFTIYKNHNYTLTNIIRKNNYLFFWHPITFKSFPLIEKPSELNFFKKIHITEPQHSSILGDLLNPLGSHQQGDTFLKLFFETIGIKYTREERWSVTIESERFDIRIATKMRNKIIIIENKSNWAEDQPHQLYRYWYYGIYLPQLNLSTDCMSRILYLSPSDYKTPSEQTLSRPEEFDKTLPEKVPINIDVIFFNNEILNWLMKCLEIIKNNHELYYYIKQYFDFWRY